MLSGKLRLAMGVFQAALLAGILRAGPPEDLDFLSGLPDFERVNRVLPEYLNRKALALLEERRRAIGQFTSATDVAKRKAYVRDKMLQALGGLPERTALNARTVGVLERDGYRIEKVIFESQPQFYVTANLYLPVRGQPPYPAVLYPLGHERGGKANPTWQQMLATLARKGYVALAWDPIGQGERVQIYNPDFADSQVRASTTEHTVQGAQCLLVGDSVARYEIWDGIRALDYLLARKEVDPSRVAVTGNSGGGMQTAYFAALEDRIHVAMPSCYLTTWERLLETIGPQDAEQCLLPWIANKLDHADFIHAFAPKPYLMLTAIRDFFSISGARTTHEEAKRIYALYGAPEKLAMFEADDTHGYSQPRRGAAYRWLGRWLKGAEDNEPESPIEPETEEELRCTESGQVVISLGGETVHSLNLRRAKEIGATRGPLASPQAVEEHKTRIRRDIGKLTGYEPATKSLEWKPFGRIERSGYRIEKLIYESEPGIPIAALLFLPSSGADRKPAVLYVHERGKSAEAAPDGQIEQLVQKGLVVLAIDARGFGESGAMPNSWQADDFYRFFGHYDAAMTAFLIGKTLVGMRILDISRGVDLLAAHPEVDAEKIYAFGVGAGAVPLLHAAVLDKRIKKVALEEMLASYESVITHRVHRGVFESVFPGVLRAYDLPDLVAALAPRLVYLTDAQDPVGKRISLAEARREYTRAFEAFKAMGAESAISLELKKPDQKLGEIFQ
ncbi:MAG: acetylxylan esterase [Acidobacteria bacterium]|nr:acetylxylan esterase [Acidobacteriota bacterium]